MPAPVPVTTLTSPRPTPQSGLNYAPARPAGLSPLIDHLGPGYVVLRLVPPPAWLEVLRLTALMLAAAFFFGVLGFLPTARFVIGSVAGRQAKDWPLLIVLGMFLAGFIMSAAAAVRQARRALKALQ